MRADLTDMAFGKGRFLGFAADGTCKRRDGLKVDAGEDGKGRNKRSVEPVFAKVDEVECRPEAYQGEQQADPGI